MAIQVRRGNETDFDAEKMLPGEWAVSLDTKYVRMCFSPGVCLRMATYEAFEADMAQIQAILEEAQTIEEAIQRVSSEVSENAVLVEEYTAEAKLYRDEAKQYRDEAFTLAPEGYENIMQDVEELRNQIVGTTSTTLSNSHAGGIKLNELGGASEQAQYSGNNLFDYNGLEQGSISAETGENETNTSIYRSADFVSCTAETDYTLSGTTNTIRIFYYDSNKALLSTELINGVFTTPANCAYFRLHATYEYFTEYTMINLGTTALPWEPFVGNQPSPNPDYPQEIDSVVVSQIKSVGKNRFPSETESGTILPDTGVEAVDSNIVRTPFASIESGSYDLSLKGDSVNLRLFYYDSKKNYIGYKDLHSTLNVVSIAENVKYFRARWNVSANLSEIQLEKGTATEYEPYQESTIDLSEPITLRGIGDYKDYIDVERGKVVRKIRRRRLLSSSDWTLHATGWIFSSDVTDFLYTEVVGTSYFSEGASTHFKYFHDRYPVINAESEGISLWYESSYNGHRCAIYSPSFSTVEELKAFLDENEVYIDYPLRTPIEEDLPTADQIALRNLSSFDTVTYISSDSEIEPSWNLEYGTSKVGAYTLEARNVAKRNEVALNELTTAVLALNQE